MYLLITGEDNRFCDFKFAAFSVVWNKKRDT